MAVTRFFAFILAMTLPLKPALAELNYSLIKKVASEDFQIQNGEKIFVKDYKFLKVSDYQFYKATLTRKNRLISSQKLYAINKRSRKVLKLVSDKGLKIFVRSLKPITERLEIHSLKKAKKVVAKITRQIAQPEKSQIDCKTQGDRSIDCSISIESRTKAKESTKIKFLSKLSPKDSPT